MSRTSPRTILSIYKYQALYVSIGFVDCQWRYCASSILRETSLPLSISAFANLSSLLETSKVFATWATKISGIAINSSRLAVSKPRISISIPKRFAPSIILGVGVVKDQIKYEATRRSCALPYSARISRAPKRLTHLHSIMRTAVEEDGFSGLYVTKRSVVHLGNFHGL